MAARQEAHLAAPAGARLDCFVASLAMTKGPAGAQKKR
jgi:hypothetical protein